jgi:hypothetical protein
MLQSDAAANKEAVILLAEIVLLGRIHWLLERPARMFYGQRWGSYLTNKRAKRRGALEDHFG